MTRRPRLRAALAVAVLAAAWIPALASVVIAWTAALPAEPVPGAFLSVSPPHVQSRFDDLGVTIAIIYGALSAALIARRPHPVVILLAMHAVGSGVAALGVQWGLLAQRADDLPLAGLLLHAAGWGYVPGTVATTIVPLLVLRPPYPRGRRALVALGLVFAAVAFGAAITHQVPGQPANPFAVGSPPLQAALPLVYGVAVTSAVLLSVGVAMLLLVRWSRGPAEGRRRLGWLVVGHSFLTLSYGALVVPAEVAVPPWVWDFGMIAPVVGQILYPSALLVLVLGRRLRGVDVAVSRVLVWSIVTLAAAGTYLVLGLLLEDVTGWSPVGIGVASAVVVAVAVIPARDLIVRMVERLVWDADDAPEDLVRRLGERVGELESGAHGLGELAAALRVALRLSSVEIATRDPERCVGRSGSPAGPATAFPLRAGGREVGTLRAAPREGERLARRVRRQLEELLPVVAVAVRLADANERLEAARDAVLEARHRERRAMRRELHDGIGPALAGVSFGLAAVAKLVTTDPKAARELVARLADDLRARLQEVRALVRAMRVEAAPIDLAEDLAELARDFSAAGPAILVEAPAASSVPPGARRTLSLIAAEAVHNAVRHAAAATIRIRLVADGPHVALEVADDGRGFAPVGAHGVGLTTMRERAAELGAAFDIRPGHDGGTIVRVEGIPSENSPAARRQEEVLA